VLFFADTHARHPETAMKSCPTCNRTFEDMMSFCLVDGSILSAPFDPNARQNQIITREEAAPPTVRYRQANSFEASANASAELPPTTPKQTVAAATVRSPISNEDAPPLSKDDQPAMKTMAASPPEMALRVQPSEGEVAGGRESEPRPTIPSARSQPTSQGPSEKRSSLRFLAIGGLAVATVSITGILWFIQHNKAANKPGATAVSLPAKESASKSAPPASSFTENVNGSEIDMVFVKGGTFVMGSPVSDPGRDQDEGPQAEVTVSGFHLSKYEITQAQYKAVMTTNPSSFKGDALPVDSVSWTDAVKFCRKLSELTGHPYRLPTEAEWEYAAKAGSSEYSAANVDALGWYDANSAGHPHAVGEKQANAFGLYDMKGNLWEWCQSKYKSYPYTAMDGRESLEGTDVRVLRGGSFESAARGCRSTYRRRVTPQPRTTGFRIVLIDS
jgi:formylglycine-generating enzyme required for sulfatase activity